MDKIPAEQAIYNSTAWEDEIEFRYNVENFEDQILISVNFEEFYFWTKDNTSQEVKTVFVPQWALSSDIYH